MKGPELFENMLKRVTCFLCRYKFPTFVTMCFFIYILIPKAKFGKSIKENITCINCERKFVTVVNAEAIPNPFNISFHINIPMACKMREIDVIMPVSTALYNFKQRATMRNSTQYRYADTPGSGLKVLFFVGMPSEKLKNGKNFQKKLFKEARKFKDIIQIRLEETYMNLVYKSLSVMYWIANNCNNSTFVLRTDDDVNIDAPSAILALYRKRKWYTDFMMGDKRESAEPVRHKKDKYYMSVKEYSGEIYPAYIGGPAMGYPTTTCLKLYMETIKANKFIWIEDVFYAGIIRERLGIPAIHDINFRTRSIHHQNKPDIFIYS